MNNNFRHEIKYLLTYAEYISLKYKINNILEKDIHSDSDGQYFIRSLYFDDIYNSSYTEKINGSDNRIKYRFRIYNYSDTSVKLETKEKKNNKIKKNTFVLPQNVTQDFLCGNLDFLAETNNDLASKTYGLIKSKNLHPSVIVDYEREAYTHALSSTRLTFDRNLRAAFPTFNINKEDLFTIPVFPNNSVILEIKYNEYLPTFLSNILSTMKGINTSLSKYCMCRQKLKEIKLYEHN